MPLPQKRKAVSTVADNKNTANAARQRKKKNKIVLFGICFVAAMAVCIASVLIVAFALVTEGTYEMPAEPVPSKTEMPVDDEAILGYVAALVNGADDNKLVKFKSTVSVSLSDFTITPEDCADSEKSLIEFVKGDIEGFVDGLYPEDFNGEFGTDYADRPVIELKTDDIAEISCVNGVLDIETGEPKLDGDGKLVDADYYNILISVKPDGAEAKPETEKLFDLAADRAALKAVAEKFGDVFTVAESDTAIDSLTVKMRVNRLTDKVDYVEFETRFAVDAGVNFAIPELKNANQQIAFTYKVVKRVNFTYSGISFSQKTVTVNPGSSDTKLSVNAVINDDSEYEVKFTSSDESIVKIDELGYITGVCESNEPVKVSVELKYLGNTFTDECEVYVRKPVEKIKISDDELTLNIGEKANLSAKLKPADATDKTVLWFTEAVDGENVAVVDENGTVTALESGTVNIVAVSDDGYFRDSCVLTVKGGDTE